MTPTITAFERSPDRGRGLARDMRVRLLPDDANARARAITRMFAALNTVEPPINVRSAALRHDHRLS